MKKKLSRREILKQGTALLSGALFAPSLIANPLHVVNENLSSPVRMMYNENPYGPSAIAQKAMQKAFSESNLYTMRDAQLEFIELMAKLNNVSVENIALGFGSREILNKAALMNAIDGGELISPNLTFEAINNFASKSMKTKVVRVPMNHKVEIDLEGMVKKINRKTKMIYICNPNNPTGLTISANKLESFCKEIPKKIIIFIDEAYHEYVSSSQYKTMTPLAVSGKNIIVSRTASKVHGLAGLRVGYAITSGKIAKRLNSYLTGSLNVIGLRGALASYADSEFQKFSIDMNNKSKKIVTDYLNNKGLKYLVSDTNFIFIKTGMNIKKLQPAMKKQGVLVGRPFPPYNDWCRLSMARPEEMELFNNGLDKELG